MSYVAYHETKSVAQQVADRKADAQWALDHSAYPVHVDSSPLDGSYYRPAVAFDVPSAH